PHLTYSTSDSTPVSAGLGFRPGIGVSAPSRVALLIYPSPLRIPGQTARRGRFGEFERSKSDHLPARRKGPVCAFLASRETFPSFLRSFPRRATSGFLVAWRFFLYALIAAGTFPVPPR